VPLLPEIYDGKLGSPSAAYRGPNVAETVAPAALNVGFLTVVQEPSGYVGGYLVTNGWGRPVEFRLSTAVQPNRVQQILYGRTLQSYICAELIGKTLFDKTGTPVALVVTDREPVLDLRQRIEVPVVWVAGSDDPLATWMVEQGAEVRPAANERGPLLRHVRFPADGPALRTLLDRFADGLDVMEPFGRIREAIAEARKMGVTSRN
jgi:hypothetical protein